MLSLIHISEPTRPLYISYAVFCLQKKKKTLDPSFSSVLAASAAGKMCNITFTNTWMELGWNTYLVVVSACWEDKLLYDQVFTIWTIEYILPCLNLYSNIYTCTQGVLGMLMILILISHQREELVILNYIVLIPNERKVDHWRHALKLKENMELFIF